MTSAIRSARGAQPHLLRLGGPGMARPHVRWRPRPRRALGTAMLGPETEAEARRETVMVVARVRTTESKDCARLQAAGVLSQRAL